MLDIIPYILCLSGRWKSLRTKNRPFQNHAAFQRVKRCAGSASGGMAMAPPPKIGWWHTKLLILVLLEWRATLKYQMLREWSKRDMAEGVLTMLQDKWCGRGRQRGRWSMGGEPRVGGEGGRGSHGVVEGVTWRTAKWRDLTSFKFRLNSIILKFH